MIKQHCEIILASNSLARKSIMDDTGLIYQSISPKFNEDTEKYSINLSSKNLALYLATKKAMSLANDYYNSYIIGSDQLCLLENNEIFKPDNQQNAVNQLKKLRNKTHAQNNAIVIIHQNKIVFKNISTARLTMHNLSDNEITNYVKYDNPVGCAGSYKFESKGKYLFSQVSGSYHTILGLDIVPILSFFYKNKLINL